MTTAEMVARKLDDDGQVFATRDGETLGQMADRAGARTERHGDATRYVFPDGSSIIALPGGWDLGLSLNCWCWQGAGHSEQCLQRAEDR
jgi:hypothetical protein